MGSLKHADHTRSERGDALLAAAMPKKRPEAKQEPTRRFAQWLASPEGQAAIGCYEVKGKQLFHPSAAVPK